MFEFRLRILDVRERDTDPPSFLGIVEGFPEVLVHATSPVQTERELVDALSAHLSGLMPPGDPNRLGRLPDRQIAASRFATASRIGLPGEGSIRAFGGA